MISLEYKGALQLRSACKCSFLHGLISVGPLVLFFCTVERSVAHLLRGFAFVLLRRINYDLI